MAKKADVKLVEKKINLFKSKLKQEGLEGAKFILFGSWAKGKQGENSDIDLCVVSDSFSGNSFQDSTFLRLMTIGIDEMLEPVAMRPEDLEDKYNTLAMEIKKYGVAV